MNVPKSSWNTTGLCSGCEKISSYGIRGLLNVSTSNDIKCTIEHFADSIHDIQTKQTTFSRHKPSRRSFRAYYRCKLHRKYVDPPTKHADVMRKRQIGNRNWDCQGFKVSKGDLARHCKIAWKRFRPVEPQEGETKRKLLDNCQMEPSIRPSQFEGAWAAFLKTLPKY